MDEIEALLYSLPHYKKVIFAVYCCNDIKHLMNQESVKSLELLKKWLEDNHNVSMEEFRGAATYMYAATATAISTNAVAYAFHVVAAALAADAAAHAYFAANASAAAHAKMKENKLAQYKTYLLKMIDELTPLEKEFI